MEEEEESRFFVRWEAVRECVVRSVVRSWMRVWWIWRLLVRESTAVDCVLRIEEMSRLWEWSESRLSAVEVRREFT